jgi:hypothetical protein
VSDRHHRVALAGERSAKFIDAEVTPLVTNIAIDADVDIRRLIHTDAEQTLLRQSGLLHARPDAVIRFSRPGGYPELLKIIEAHGYAMSRAGGELASAREVAADCYDTVYLPGVAALRREACRTSITKGPTPISSCGCTNDAAWPPPAVR